MTVETLEQPRVGGERELEVSFRHIGPVCVLTLRGALLVGTVRVLESQFDRLWRTPCRRVVLELRDLREVDETGTRVLTGLHHYVRARGGSLTVVGASSWVRAALTSSPLLDPGVADPGDASAS